MMQKPKGELTVSELAKLLKKDPSTVRRFICSLQLKYPEVPLYHMNKKRGKIRISVASLVQLRPAIFINEKSNQLKVLDALEDEVESFRKDYESLTTAFVAKVDRIQKVILELKKALLIEELDFNNHNPSDLEIFASMCIDDEKEVK